MGQYQTFVVRIWTDGTTNPARGHIQHIASRRGQYFRDEQKMMRFIREFLDPSALQATDADEDVSLDEASVESTTSIVANDGDTGRNPRAAD
jgi:hypothetical protein